MKQFLFFLVFVLASCTTNWSKEELSIINSKAPLRVLTIDNHRDSLILRSISLYLSDKELLSEHYNTLCEKLVQTVTDPSQDGVGIAGPQVGILKRLVAVQRFDKEGEPFEVYPNIKIIARRGDCIVGSEGCLSVPNRSGDVARSQDIDISYSIIDKGTIRDTTETVQGFTAVIFGHECDHLDGVIYTDYLRK